MAFPPLTTTLDIIGKVTLYFLVQKLDVRIGAGFLGQKSLEGTPMMTRPCPCTLGTWPGEPCTGRQAAFAGHVDDQDDLAFEVPRRTGLLSMDSMVKS